MNKPDPTNRPRPGRKVRVFSELNRDLRPEDLARILVAAGLERARKEAAARREQAAREELSDE